MRRAAPQDSTRAPADAQRHLAARILRLHLGERPRRLEPLGGGLTNQVFRLETRGRSYVIRLHDDEAKLADYRKEEWAMAQARGVDVPTPRVLAIGVERQRPFMILEEVRGIPATHWSEPASVLRQLGECAARLHSVRTQGFGRAIGTGQLGPALWPNWAEFLDNELRLRERLQLLDRMQLLAAPARRQLDISLQEMRGWRRRPVLQHGDLRLKNVMVSPEDGRIVALLDWEDCLSAPAPFWDLAIALHDLGPDEKEAFLEGYRLTPGRFERMAPVLRVLNLLNYAWVIGQASGNGQRRQVAWLKARLRGAFDVAL